MITTPASRRPSLSTRPRPGKGRRVSFAEPSDDESSQKPLPVESDWLEMGHHPAPVPYDSGHSPDIQVYSLQMASPMSRLNLGASPTNFFVGQPPVSPRPYWMTRQPQFVDRPRGFESSANVLREEADGEHDKAGLPPLRNLCIAVLVEAVLSVLVFIAVTVDLPAAFDRPETPPPPPFVMGVGRGKVVAPLEPMTVPPAKGGWIVTARPAVKAATPTPVNLQPGVMPKQPRRPQRAENRTMGHRDGSQCRPEFLGC